MLRLRVGLVLVVLVAGCGSPKAPAEPDPVPATTSPPPTYDATIVVTQETPDGAPLAGEVQAVPVLEDGTLGTLVIRPTDADGAVRFSFRAPTTLLVRAVGPDGWTQEGARVHIGTAVAAQGVTVSDRDVFLPLFRSSLSFGSQHAWSTVLGDPRPDGGPAMATLPLAFPEGLQAAYLARLDDAAVVASWMDSEQGAVATASAGLAWDGRAWVEGPAAEPSVAGERTAAWDGDLPAGGWPADRGAATLEAALFTRTAIVGEVLFDVETTLRFGGFVPAQMPAEDCHLLC